MKRGGLKGWLRRLEAVPKDGGRVSRRFAVVQSEPDPLTQVNNAVRCWGSVRLTRSSGHGSRA